MYPCSIDVDLLLSFKFSKKPNLLNLNISVAVKKEDKKLTMSVIVGIEFTAALLTRINFNWDSDE